MLVLCSITWNIPAAANKYAAKHCVITEKESHERNSYV